MTRERQRMWLAGAWLVVLVLGVYVPVIVRGGYFFDDSLLLVNNAAIWRMDGLHEIWLTANHPDYFPLTSTSFWLEARVWGHAAWGYHLDNVLLHAAAAVLLWRVLEKLGVKWAWLAALLFAVTPVDAMSVSWISERKNTLSMVLLCAAAWAYLRFQDWPEEGSAGWEKWRPYVWVMVFFVGSLLAKSSGVMLPVILLVLMLWRRGRITGKDLRYTGPLFVVSGVMGLVTVWFQHFHAIGEMVVREDSFYSRLTTAGAAIWWYLGKALVPVDLMFVYPRWTAVEWLGRWAIVPGAAFVGLLVTLALIRKRAARGLLAMLVIYGLLMLPMLGFVNIYFMRYSLVADYWQYQASAVVYAGVAAALAWGAQKMPGMGMVLKGLGGAAVAACAVGTFLAATTDARAETIWRDNLAKNPQAWVAEEALGQMLLKRGEAGGPERAEAIEHLRKAYALAPDEAMNAINLGLGYQEAGDAEQALAFYRRAVEAPHADVQDRNTAYMDAAALLIENHAYGPAGDLLRKAIDLDPASGLAAYRMGALEVRRGNLRAAMDNYQLALEREPGMGQARYALAVAEAQTGQTAAAAKDVGTLMGLPESDPAVRAQVAKFAAEGPPASATEARRPATRPGARAGGRGAGRGTTGTRPAAASRPTGSTLPR